MRFLSQISAELHHHPTDRTRHRALVAKLFGEGPVADALLRFLDAPAHVLLDRRIVTALQRLLLTDASWDARELTADDRATLLLALLALVDALPDASPPDSDDESTEIEDLEPWLPFVIQLGCAAATDVYVVEGIARAHAMYRVFATDDESRGHPQYCDIAALLERAGGGLSADEQLAVALSIISGTSTLDRDAAPEDRRTLEIQPTYLKDTSMNDRSDGALTAIAADRRWFVDRIGETNDDPRLVAWDHSLFEARPLLRLESGNMLLSGPSALMAWMGRGVYFRALAAAQQTADPSNPGQQMSRRFLNFAGTLGERYVRTLVKRSLAAAERAGAVVVCGDQPYKVRRQLRRAPDVTVASGPDLVLIEVCSGRISLDARTSAAPARVREQVDKLVTKKLIELDRRVAEFLDPKLRFTLDGIDRPAIQRVLPLLVLSGDSLAVESVLLRYVATARPGLFADARVQAPVITDLEGLERALALCEHRGHTLTDL
jgi:hypothetical protein